MAKITRFYILDAGSQPNYIHQDEVEDVKKFNTVYEEQVELTDEFYEELKSQYECERYGDYTF